MPAFDPQAYEDAVLKPLRRLMPHLPKDLAARYAVEPGMDATALRERVEAVVRLWNKQAMRQGPLGLVSQQLVHEHNQFLTAGDDPAAPAFWAAWTTQHHRDVGGAIDAFTAELRTMYGPLKVITREQLRAQAITHSDLGDAELERARTQAGLDLVEPVELPTSAQMRGQLKTFNDAVLASGALSLPQLLFPALTEFGLLGGLTVTPAPPGRTVALTAAAAAERMVELDKLPDSQRVRAERQALGLVVTEGKAGVDLHRLALFHLLQEARQRQADGTQPPVLYAILTRTKLRPADAGRLVVSLLAQGGVRRSPVDAVTDLLTEGRLIAAQAAAAALTGADGDAARAAVQEQRDRVQALRGDAEGHLRAGRDEQAAAGLREALAQAVDLPGLAEQLAGIPTAPVLSCRATPDAGGVRVTWRAAATHGRATVVRVVRGDDRTPDAPDDGTDVPVAGGHATDAAPPVGRTLYYGVFARDDGGRWSRPVHASVRIVPSVTDLVVEGGPGVVTGHWRVHPEVAAVEVRRTAGTPDGPEKPLVVERNRSFRDADVVDGTPYFYTVVAIYPSPSGGPALRSAPVTGRGSTRLAAKPVAVLTATPVSGGVPTVRLTWRQPWGNDVVIRRAAQECPWGYGVCVPATELPTYGAEVDGHLTARGESMTLVATLPPGRSWLVPFTVDADGSGVRGQDTSVDLVDPVRRVQARRFGDDVHLTWLWPDGAGAAEVVWPGGHRRITLQQYRDEGGCHVRGVPAVRRVEISAVVPGGDDGGWAPAVPVDVVDRPTKIGYELHHRGHRFAGGVRCTVTLSSAEPVTRATVVLVGSAGRVMPQAPDDCVELLREVVTLQPGLPSVLPEVTVPSVLRKPYWLRCFLVGPVAALLVDPPVSQLKVS